MRKNCFCEKGSKGRSLCRNNQRGDRSPQISPPELEILSNSRTHPWAQGDPELEILSNSQTPQNDVTIKWEAIKNAIVF